MADHDALLAGARERVDLMPQWPKNESPTGQGYSQGSDSYNQSDMDRMALEERKIAQEREEARLAARQKLIPPGGIDFDANLADDPNFGDYNVTPGGNHP